MTTKKTSEPAAEVEPYDAEGIVVARQGDAGLAKYLMNEADDTPTDSVSTYASIVGQIMASESWEDVLTPTEVLSVRQVVDRPFQLITFHFNKSEFDVGSPYYASMDVIFDDDHTKAVVNCGHQALMAQLLKLIEFNEFPYHVVVFESGRPNRFGNTPLRLKKAG